MKERYLYGHLDVSCIPDPVLSKQLEKGEQK